MKTRKTRVCVLSGGDSIERDISILSCNEIMNFIDRKKYDVINIEVPETKDTSWVYSLLAYCPDIVLIAMHGGKGENGSVQGFLECISVPYVGSKVLASAISMDKEICKTIMRANNIPVVEGISIHINDNLIEYKERIEEITYPILVKPNSGGGSIGISIAQNYKELLLAIENGFKFDSTLILEKYIKGKEVACAIIQDKNGIDVLNILDIDSSNNFYDFKSKYLDTVNYINFSELPDYQKTMIKEIGKKLFRVLNCRGIAVVDMIINEEQIYVLEINTLPGFTSKSIIPKSISNKKDFKKFLTELIEFELEKH